MPDATLVHVEGADAQPYLHNYGTAGIIARATVALEPLQDWHGLFASFDRFEQALAVIRPFAAIEPTPRLVSADPPMLAEALPGDAGIPAGRSSLRAIVDRALARRRTGVGRRTPAAASRTSATASAPRCGSA